MQRRYFLGIMLSPRKQNIASFSSISSNQFLEITLDMIDLNETAKFIVKSISHFY